MGMGCKPIRKNHPKPKLTIHMMVDKIIIPSKSLNSTSSEYTSLRLSHHIRALISINPIRSLKSQSRIFNDIASRLTKNPAIKDVAISIGFELQTITLPDTRNVMKAFLN